MASTLNRVMLIGNLGRDPEVRKFENGGTVVNFPIATSDSYWDREKQERISLPTDWHNIVVRRGGLTSLAERYLRKGDKVGIEGKLKTRTYEKDGQTHYVTEIVAEDLILLSSGQNSAQPTPASDLSGVKAEKPKSSLPESGAEDDLPF